LEADQIGRGATAFSSGWIAENPGVLFGDLEKTIGLRSARYAWQAWRRAALDFAALVRRLDIKCHLEECGSVTVALTPEQLARLKRDQKSRREAGVDAPLLNARTIKKEFGLDGMAGRGRKGRGEPDSVPPCGGMWGRGRRSADR